MLSRLYRAFVTVMAVAFSITLAGCWTHRAARPYADFEAAALRGDAWPRRYASVVSAICDATPEKIVHWRIKEGVDPAELTPEEHILVDRIDRTVAYKGVYRGMLLRVYEQPPVRVENIFNRLLALFNKLGRGFEPNASIMSSYTTLAAARDPLFEQRTAIPWDYAAGTASARSHIEFIGDDVSDQSAGLAARVPPPNTSTSAKPRGVVIHLHAIAGNDYELRVMQELRRRGWAEIELKVDHSFHSPISDDAYAEIVRLRVEEHDLMIKLYRVDEGTEGEKPVKLSVLESRARASAEFPRFEFVQRRLSLLRGGGYQACSGADLPGIAQQIATEIDECMAEAAYGVEALVNYIDTARPDLQGVPVVLVGFSAGALAGPTAALRVHDRLAAVVLIGGACDLFAVSQGSTFSDGGLKILCGEKKAPKEVVRKINELYMERARLDPYYTAPLIADLPVLQVHASWDHWVPAQYGRLLYERLNRPERLTMHGGHQLLFYFLPRKAEWIADWIERAAPAR